MPALRSKFNLEEEEELLWNSTEPRSRLPLLVFGSFQPLLVVWPNSLWDPNSLCEPKLVRLRNFFQAPSLALAEPRVFV